jgi:hypothetical protein
LPKHGIGGHKKRHGVDTIWQEPVIYLFSCLPGLIVVEVKPPLDNATAAADLNCYVCRLARNQRGDREPFFIIVEIIVKTEGISIRLAVRLTVRLIVLVTEPRSGNHMIGAVVKGDSRVTRRDRSGRGVTPVVFERFVFSSWIN